MELSFWGGYIVFSAIFSPDLPSPSVIFAAVFKQRQYGEQTMRGLQFLAMTLSCLSFLNLLAIAIPVSNAW